jgi:hypothetical protein
MPNAVLGIDLDNTIIQYDELVHAIAVEMGLAPPSLPIEKGSVRDHVRAGPHGDRGWQQIQAAAYGPRIGDAPPFPGAVEYIAACARSGIKVTIVSHKTRTANAGSSNFDLRETALDWLAGHGLLAPGAGGIRSENVHFLDDRDGKVAKIATIRPELFVDDLPEVFEHPGFPREVRPILFAPSGADQSPWDVLRSWGEAEHVLGRP